LVVLVEDAPSESDARQTIVDVSRAVYAAHEPRYAAHESSAGAGNDAPLRGGVESLAPRGDGSPDARVAGSTDPGVLDSLPPHIAGAPDSVAPHVPATPDSLPPRIAEQVWRVPDGQGRLALLGDPRTETAAVPGSIQTAA